MRVRLVLTGKVQGVGFRQLARVEADKNSVKGYVRNMPDGSVVIVGEADELRLKKFVDACRRGPLVSFVQDCKIEYKEGTAKYREFEVRF